MTTRIFFFFYFLRDQNSQHFNEDLLGVNASAFSFVLCFKAINYAGASNYVVSPNEINRRLYMLAMPRETRGKQLDYLSERWFIQNGRANFVKLILLSKNVNYYQEDLTCQKAFGKHCCFRL